MATKSNILILPGFNQKNIEWAQGVSQKLAGQFKTEVYKWRHWRTNNESDFSAEDEAEAIATKLTQSSTSKTTIIAKSIGTLVAALLIRDLGESIDKIILCGVPLNDIPENEWNKYSSLKTFKKGEGICFQNNDDSHGNYAQVSNFLKTINLDIPVIEKPGSNHDYQYFDDFKNFLLN